ncbi:MAG: hypothetical protein EHM32_10110, partial [Spirochaetales bacterium]
ALKGGFTQITSKADPNCARITDGLGEHYSIMDIYFKPYTACRHTHGAAQSALELVREHTFTAGDVDSVSVHTYGIAELAVGKGVPEGGSFVSAQFSIPYVVAVCILDGDLGPGQLTERRIADGAVLELAKRVSIRTDDELNKAYPDKTSSRVEVVLKDGRRLVKQTDIPKGDPRDPMEAEDLAAKLRRFAGKRDAAKLERIIDMVMGMEKLRDLKELARII